MDVEKSLVDRSMEIFRRMRERNDDAVNAALARYLGIIPDPMLQGMAQDKVRKYMRARTDKAALSETELNVLTAQISMQILDELINKVRKRAVINEQQDGAEIFYRRALSHIGCDRYSDAERLLRRAVEICPDFVDGWDVLVEVLEHNGKAELAMQARLRLRELKKEI